MERGRFIPTKDRNRIRAATVAAAVTLAPIIVQEVNAAQSDEHHYTTVGHSTDMTLNPSAISFELKYCKSAERDFRNPKAATNVKGENRPIHPPLLEVIKKQAQKRNILMSCLEGNHTLCVHANKTPVESDHPYGRGGDILGAAPLGQPPRWINASNPEGIKVLKDVIGLPKGLRPTQVLGPYPDSVVAGVPGSEIYSQDAGHKNHLHLGYGKPSEYKAPTKVCKEPTKAPAPSKK